MPRIKRSAVKRGKTIKKISSKISSSWQEDNSQRDLSVMPIKKSSSKARNIIFILILVAALLLWKFKGYFIVATVNNQPISRWELNNTLTRKFGTQTLDNIINERLILGAVRQKGIYVTPNEIDQKIEEITKKLEGKMTIDEALKYQGLTQEEFKRQIEIQLSVDRLFDKETTVSASEVEDYIKKNSQLGSNSTDPAALREEVRGLLQQQKTSEAFDAWFSEIRKSAKIQKSIE